MRLPQINPIRILETAVESDSEIGTTTRGRSGGENMSEEKGSLDIEAIRKKWNERAKGYDEWYKTFKGAVEHYVEWEILRGHLPRDRDARILDAPGGTGRITLPLAKMGYSVTLSDISSGMIEVAKQKVLTEGVLGKVTISECDVCNMPFPDESFDFTLCWGGGIEATKELVRVTKRKGKISICAMSRYGTAIRKFRQDPEHALALLTSQSDYDFYEGEKYRVVTEEEARELLEKEGVRIIGIYTYDIWELLSLPDNVLASRDWDGKLFRQTTELMLRLAKEPSVRGTSRHFALYGEKM
jgi:ubiquinone/menaquinone biosynthesis C-methylase UbiE